MPFRYLDEMTTADVAFEALGASVEEVFSVAADATEGVMTQDISAIRANEETVIALTNNGLDLLLLDFLNELIFLKDARGLLLRVTTISIEKDACVFNLKATLAGERIDASKHVLGIDVKAVTLHALSVTKTDDGTWKATVVLDV
ncbi:MAG: archease [Deltaproteobacteria bacterium]|nr:archease [Deltaproteobacteria bacterium]